jgi:NAD-dependent SIR2 family protein deacetylase
MHESSFRSEDDTATLYRKTAEFKRTVDRSTPTTSVHEFLFALHSAGKLRRVYSMNLDGKERSAGVPIEKIVQMHGGLDTVACRTNCGYRTTWTEAHTFAFSTGSPLPCPKCSNCSRPKARLRAELRPSIVFTGESDNPEGKIALILQPLRLLLFADCWLFYCCC